MAIDRATDAIIEPYTRQVGGGLDVDPQQYLSEELRKIEMSIESLRIAIPQLTDVAPTKPQRGMQRYAVSPWDPGSGSDKWYYYTGSAWAVL